MEMCIEGRDCEIYNHDEGNQHPKDKKTWVRNLPKIYEDFDESLEKMETLDNGYLWEMCQYVCRMLIPTGRCHDEDPSSKVLFDLMLCFDFLNNIWMSSCRATGTKVGSTSTTSIQVVDGNS